jgi:polar amino acid transport system permease protein
MNLRYRRSTTFEELRAASGKTPLVRRNAFLAGSFAGLVVYGAALFSLEASELAIRLAITLYILLLLTWTGIFISDEKKKSVLKTGAAFLTLFVLIGLFLKFKVENHDEIIDLFFNASVIEKSWPYLVQGFWTTVQIALCAAVVSTIIGVTLAVFQSFNNRVLNFFIVAYVDFFRAIPIIVLLMLIYYGLPFLNIRLSAFASGVLGLGLNSGAYVSEIFRAGFLSLDRGQIEACRALGMNSWQTVIKVLLPQAVRAITPPLVGNYVSSAKDTALCSSISIIELLKAGTAQQSMNANPSPLIFVAAMYLILFLPLTRFTGHLELRMKRTDRCCDV